jgi:uncharacterized protein (TIGR02186 family)
MGVRVLRPYILLALLWLSVFNSKAMAQESGQPLTIDLSVKKIDIHSGFTGRDVTLFGIQKAKGKIVIVVRGPSLTMVLREKSNVAGMWLTTSSVKFIEIPGYYAVASNASVPLLADQETLRAQQIGLDYLNIQPKKLSDFVTNPSELKRMQDAFIQTQQLRGLFVLRTEPITYVTDELFKLDLWFPSNIPVGTYTVDAYLFENQELIGKDHKELVIARAGFNASLREFSQESPWRYAALTILIAMLSGWLATVILKRD